MAVGDTVTVFKGQLIRHPSRAWEAATGRLWPGSPLLLEALGPSRPFLQAAPMTLESIVSGMPDLPGLQWGGAGQPQ